MRETKEGQEGGTGGREGKIVYMEGEKEFDEVEKEGGRNGGGEK